MPKLTRSQRSVAAKKGWRTRRSSRSLVSTSKLPKGWYWVSTGLHRETLRGPRGGQHGEVSYLVGENRAEDAQGNIRYFSTKKAAKQWVLRKALQYRGK